MADTEALVNQLGECAQKRDFVGAFGIIRENKADLAAKMDAAGFKDALKKTTDDRLLLSFIEGSGFGAQPLDKALVMLEKLLSFRLDTLVLNDTWGLGKVRRLDYFYRRITVDFKTKKGHQFTYAAACDMLSSAPEDHILVLRERDPQAFETLFKDKPGEFIKAVLKANGGSMTLVRLEDYCLQNSLVKAANWKAYWEKARAELKHDKCVLVPARKADPIQVREAAEDYGDGWLVAFSHETDPKLILASVREYCAQCKFSEVAEEKKAKIGERLAFAVTAAKHVDDALYARLACEIVKLGFTAPAAEEMRDYLWERKRYIRAAEALPAREVGAMVAFLAQDDAARAKICAAIPELNFAAVQEIVSQFKDQTATVPTEDGAGERTVHPCRRAIGDYMKAPTAPATLVTLIVGKIESFGEFKYGDVDVDGKKIRVLKSYRLWEELPSLITLLTHAIALGEGRRGGETLRMQNLVRRLFGDKAWLEKMFKLLDPADRVVFFERFQASIAWDPSTHHATVVRMTKLAPELEKHLVKVEKKREYARLTSYRSFAMKKAEYLKLINVDMPENVRKIEFAKGFGDLSENAEYQYAKDEQRALMQKQTMMQADLESVKPSDFADATVEEVMPGVTVVVSTPDGEKTYHVLGEWDNDVERGVLSSKAQLAVNLLGKRAGDDFELPAAAGSARFGKVLAIKPLPDDIREWMKLPAGMQI